MNRLTLDELWEAYKSADGCGWDESALRAVEIAAINKNSTVYECEYGHTFSRPIGSAIPFYYETNRGRKYFCVEHLPKKCLECGSSEHSHGYKDKKTGRVFARMIKGIARGSPYWRLVRICLK